MEKTYEFGYWPTMGLGQGIRYILHFERSRNPNLKFTENTYFFTDYDRWITDKEEQKQLTSFPNLPYLKITTVKNNYLSMRTGEDVNNSTLLITQSDAILKALGLEFGLEGKSLDEQIKIDTVSGVLTDFYKGLLDHIFSADKWKSISDFHQTNVMNGFCEQLDNHLKENKYVAGDNLSWCDFKMLHFLTVASILSERLRSTHKSIDRFMDSMVNGFGEEFKKYYSFQLEDRGILPPFEIQQAFNLNCGWPEAAGKTFNKIQPIFRRKVKL